MAEKRIIIFPIAVPLSGLFIFNARIVPIDARSMPPTFLFVRGSLRNDAASMMVNSGPVDCKILLIGAEVYTMPKF